MLSGTYQCRDVNKSGAREANGLHIHLHMGWGSRYYLLWQARDMALNCLPPPHPFQISFLVINTSKMVGVLGEGGGTTLYTGVFWTKERPVDLIHQQWICISSLHWPLYFPLDFSGASPSLELNLHWVLGYDQVSKCLVWTPDQPPWRT